MATLTMAAIKAKKLAATTPLLLNVAMADAFVAANQANCDKFISSLRWFNDEEDITTTIIHGNTLKLTKDGSSYGTINMLSGSHVGVITVPTMNCLVAHFVSGWYTGDLEEMAYPGTSMPESGITRDMFTTSVYTAISLDY